MAIPVETVSPNSPKLLGREITAWIGVANAAVAVLVTQKFVSWSPEQTSLVLSLITAVFAVIAAIAVRPFPVPVLSGLLTAVLTLAAGFGFNITDEQVGIWNALLVGVMGLVMSTRTSPEPKIDPFVSHRAA